MRTILIVVDEMPLVAREVLFLLRCSHSDSPDDKEKVIEILNVLMNQCLGLVLNRYTAEEESDDNADGWLWNELDDVFLNFIEARLAAIIDFNSKRKMSVDKLHSVDVIGINGDIALKYED